MTYTRDPKENSGTLNSNLMLKGTPIEAGVTYKVGGPGACSRRRQGLADVSPD
jgi:hypothetical protein